MSLEMASRVLSQLADKALRRGDMKFMNMKLRRSARKSALGMTLPETLVGVGVGSLVLTSMMLIFMTSNRSFVALGNYVSLDQASRLAVEQMTRDIRNSQNLTSFSTNQLVFTYAGTTNLVYTYRSEEH